MNAKTKALVNLQELEFSPVTQGEPSQEDPVSRSIEKLRSSLSIQVLREYDFRKQRYGAHCVVPLQNGMCTGCNVMLSLRTQRLARYHVIECEHCGRLLYNPERRRKLCIEVCAA